MHTIYICMYYILFYKVAYVQIRGHLDTLQLMASSQGEGHLRMSVYSTLLIEHKTYAGEQRVACWPFKGKTLQKSNRQDLVFARPPGIDKGGFQLRIDSVWFCRAMSSSSPLKLGTIKESSGMIAPSDASSSRSCRNTTAGGAQVVYRSACLICFRIL
jgi:hypothetical protein